MSNAVKINWVFKGSYLCWKIQELIWLSILLFSNYNADHFIVYVG